MKHFFDMTVVVEPDISGSIRCVNQLISVDVKLH